MQFYKVDWLAFSQKFEDEEAYLDFSILEKLGYKYSDFESIKGKNFYNSGYTIGNYVSLFYNDPLKECHRFSSKTQTVIFTGQGATDLALKWDSDWIAIFSLLKDLGVNFTRLDLALDDYDGLVDFGALEAKLKAGHYHSSRKSYNITKTSDEHGNPLGQTFYIGSPRSDGGGKGKVYARIYDKKAQYDVKGELYPTLVRDHWERIGKEVWQRFEISYSKQYAISVIDNFLTDGNIDRVFKTSMRNLLEILTPKKGKRDKKQWYRTKWWEDFLGFNDKIRFDLPERDVMLGDLLKWIGKAVLPSLGLLELIGSERGFDIYYVLEKAKKKPLHQLSKKQIRLYENSKSIPSDVIQGYLSEYLPRGKKEEEHGKEIH